MAGYASIQSNLLHKETLVICTKQTLFVLIKTMVVLNSSPSQNEKLVSKLLLYTIIYWTLDSY